MPRLTTEQAASIERVARGNEEYHRIIMGGGADVPAGERLRAAENMRLLDLLDEVASLRSNLTDLDEAIAAVCKWGATRDPMQNIRSIGMKVTEQIDLQLRQEDEIAALRDTLRLCADCIEYQGVNPALVAKARAALTRGGGA